MGKSDPSYGFIRQIRVGNLKRHSDGQSQVGEVQIGGRVFLIEVDAPYWLGIEGTGVAQGEHGVDQPPRQGHAQYSECDQVSLGSSDCLTSSDEDQSDGREQSDPRGKNDEFGQPDARVFSAGMRFALVGTQLRDGEPDPGDETRGRRVPAYENRCL